MEANNRGVDFFSGTQDNTQDNAVRACAYVFRYASATISTIKKLCDGFGITIQEFFDAEQFHDLEQEVK